MSTALLLAIATASIVILLLLVIKAKVHPFVALLIVSLLVAIATGIPAEKIMETIITGRLLKPRAVPSRWRSVSVKRWG
jgi:GntP family gluconate:H+ symporter